MTLRCAEHEDVHHPAGRFLDSGTGGLDLRQDVRDTADDQAIGTSQSNVQGMAAAANIGNGSVFGGPATIQSDNTFTQTASNSNVATNVDAFLLLARLGSLWRAC